MVLLEATMSSTLRTDNCFKLGAILRIFSTAVFVTEVSVQVTHHPVGSTIQMEGLQFWTFGSVYFSECCTATEIQIFQPKLSETIH